MQPYNLTAVREIGIGEKSLDLLLFLSDKCPFFHRGKKAIHLRTEYSDLNSVHGHQTFCMTLGNTFISFHALACS